MPPFTQWPPGFATPPVPIMFRMGGPMSGRGVGVPNYNIARPMQQTQDPRRINPRAQQLAQAFAGRNRGVMF